MGVFFEGEAEEVPAWEGVDLHLAPASLGWRKVVRALQAASIKAAKAIGIPLMPDKNMNKIIGYVASFRSWAIDPVI